MKHSGERRQYEPIVNLPDIHHSHLIRRMNYGSNYRRAFLRKQSYPGGRDDRYPLVLEVYAGVTREIRVNRAIRFIGAGSRQILLDNP